jgi:hypothetical protein
MNRYIGEQGEQDDDGVGSDEDGRVTRVRSGSSERSGRRRRWDRGSNKGQKSHSVDLVYPFHGLQAFGESQKYTYPGQDTPRAKLP